MTYHEGELLNLADNPDSVPFDLPTGSEIQWLEALGEPASQGALLEQLASGKHPQQVATDWLQSKVVLKGGSEEYQLFLARLTREVTELLCGSPRYRSERQELRRLSEYTRTSVLAIIAGAVGAHFGAYGYLVPPLVAIMLGLIGRVGLNAWCTERQ